MEQQTSNMHQTTGPEQQGAGLQQTDNIQKKTRKKGPLIAIICAVVVVAVVVLVLFLTGVIGAGGGEMVVGKKVSFDKITEFYYTYDKVGYQGEYQRYYFHVDDGRHIFYHEYREVGEDNYGFPSQADIAESGEIELSDEQWNQFLSLIEGGTVIARQDHLETGDAGPWLYLYWTGDRGDIQEFSFASWEKEKDFEAFCEELKQQ